MRWPESPYPSNADTKAPLAIADTSSVTPPEPASPPELVKPYVPPPPPANYSDSENGIYFYLGEPSKAEKKSAEANGRTASNVVSYKYFGINNKGEHILQAETGFRTYCKDPCKLIRVQDGSRIPNSDTLLLGLVFADAINGHLIDSSKTKNSTSPRKTTTQ